MCLEVLQFFDKFELLRCNTLFNKDYTMKKTLLPLLAAGLLMTACNDGQNVDVEASCAPGTPGDFKKNIKDRVFFAFDKANVSADGQKVAESQAAWLKTHSATTATLEGHSDERGTRDYNQALAARRAEAVKSALGKNGVDAARLKTVSFGKDKPVVPNAANEEQHAQNRVVVTTIN
jgi:peptidoglycan-associated lipoprotein